MIDHDTDCLNVLTQLKAIRSAVGSVMDSVIENQFDKCMKSLKQDDKAMLFKLKNYVKSN